MYYNENTIVFANGTWTLASEAHVSLYSQTLHYGMGIFEGIRAYPVAGGTRIFKAREHYERLLYSAKKMHISVPYSVEELIDLSYLLLEKNQMHDAYIRPLVYAEPLMKLVPPKNAQLFLCAWAWGRYLGDSLLNVCISPFERPNPRAGFSDAKVTGHYTNSILATHDALSRNYDEALLLDRDGFVAEGSGANFFYEKDGKLFTAPQGSILMGITRSCVFELCQQMGIVVEECLFTPDILADADAAFFTGTAAEIAGIASIDNRPFAKPWEESIGYQLSREYKKMVLCEEKYAN